MYEFNFKNWKHFKSEMIKKLEDSCAGVSVTNFLFRGQANASWSLWSSFDRIEKNKSKYVHLLEEFKKICNYYNFNEELFSKGDDKVIAAYAQHYGLPTRLLDWTLSPYFGAFFAFSGAYSSKSKSGKCTVWGINKESEALRQKGGIDFVSLPSNKFNYRMKNQVGHFTLSSHTEDSIEEFDTTIVKSTGIDDMLWKLNIPIPSDVQPILVDLELMGINYSTVYPDIQGYIEEAIFKSEIRRP
jgi:hypothetical protein